MVNFNVNNFIVLPTPGQKLEPAIRIYDSTGVYRFSIEPWISNFTQKNKYVYIILQNNILYQNTLDFSNDSEALQALTKLNEVKKIYATSTDKSLSDYYTKIESDSKYYTKDQIIDNYYKKDYLDDNFYKVPELEDGTASLTLSALTIQDINVYDTILNIGSGGTIKGMIVVREQNTGLIKSGVTTLNFIGNPSNNIRVISNGEHQVDVWIFAPSYVNKFNMSSSTIVDFPMTTRRIASPSSEGSPYYIGGWSGDENHSCTDSTTLVYITPTTFSLETTATTFIVEVSTPYLTAVTNTSNFTLNGNGVYTSNNVIITVTNFGVDQDKWQCSITVSINLSNIIPQGGRFNIKLQHNNEGDDLGPYIYTQTNCFYDSPQYTMSISGLTLIETVGMLSTRMLSGVKYYNYGSRFTVNVSNISYPNDRSYPDHQLILEGYNDYGFTTLSVGRTDLTFWNSSYNDTDDTYENTSWSIGRLNWYRLTNSGRVYANGMDWNIASALSSSTNGVAIDTWQYDDDRISEDFTHETNRYHIDLVTLWDNTNSLLVEDDGNGLQLSNSRLVYPTINYNYIFDPDKHLQPNYSGLTGSRTWLRKFWHPTLNSSNGILRFGGHNYLEGDIVSGSSTKILLDISIDSGLSWYSMNKLYFGGTLINGSGCRINNDTYNMSNNQMEFTFGSGKYSKDVWIRITYLYSAKDKYLGSVDLIGGNWV